MTTEDARQIIENIIAAIDLWELREAGQLPMPPLLFGKTWARANEEGRRLLFELIDTPRHPALSLYPTLSALLYVMSGKEYALYYSPSEKAVAEQHLQRIVDTARECLGYRYE